MNRLLVATMMALSMLLSFICKVSRASEFRATPIESAVLGVEDGRLVALPVLSFPTVAEQTERPGYDAMEAVFESRMDTAMSSTDCASRKVNAESGGWGCSTPALHVAKHHHMHFVPRQWSDSSGRKYSTRGGWMFENAGGSGVGLDLGPAPKEPTAAVVLLSDSSGFPKTTVIGDTEWKQWPELRSEVARWAKARRGACREDIKCVRAVSQLAVPERFDGTAKEFVFASGTKIQYLHASSQSVGDGVLSQINKPDYEPVASTEPDTLNIDLWRVVSNDGAARTLRVKESYWNWLRGTAEMVNPYCDSQCSGGWDGEPELFTASGRVFAYGAYTGGTTSGYMFLEILSTELKFLGWYRWGS